MARLPTLRLITRTKGGADFGHFLNALAGGRLVWISGSPTRPPPRDGARIGVVGGLAQLGDARTARHSPVASKAWARFIAGTVRRGLPAARSHSVTGRRRQGACRTAWRAGRL